MVYRADADTELCRDSESPLRHIRTFLEFLYASINVLSKEVFHAFT